MDRAARPAMDAGRDHHQPGDRRERPARLPRREPSRPRHVLRHVPRPHRQTELRPLHLPRQRRTPLLPELGPGRQHDRREPAHRGRERPARQTAPRTRRELSTRSDEFRRRWHAHDVRTHGTGTKHFHHHVVGDLELAYESLDLRAEPGHTLTVYTAEPSSPTAHALALLASWAATETQDTHQTTAQLNEVGP